ncbi:MAG: C-terminal binding protein [Chitinophagales bacterium]
MRPLIVLTDYDYPSVELEKSIVNHYGIDFFPSHCQSEDEIIELTREADGVMVQYARITPRIIAEMKKCKVIVRYGVGVDSLDVTAATAKNIIVCNVPDYGLEEVANHTMGLLLDAIRKITLSDRQVHSGKWDYSELTPIYRVTGKKLGLIAFGNIARLVTQRAQSFGMKILVYDPLVSEDVINQYGAIKVSFEQLLIEADYISIHCPLTHETKYMFNRYEFSVMKPTAILVNTSRGAIIKQTALAEALINKKISLAAIDVVEQEPLPETSPLMGIDNLIITPQMAWYSIEAEKALKTETALEAARVVSGLPPKHPVNI